MIANVEKVLKDVRGLHSELEQKLPPCSETWSKKGRKWIENLGIFMTPENCKILFDDLDKIIKQIVKQYTGEEKIEGRYLCLRTSDLMQNWCSIIIFEAHVGPYRPRFYLTDPHPDINLWDPQIYCIQKSIELFYQNNHQFVDFTFGKQDKEFVLKDCLQEI